MTEHAWRDDTLRYQLIPWDDTLRALLLVPPPEEAARLAGGAGSPSYEP